MNGDNLYSSGIILCVIALFSTWIITLIHYSEYKKKPKNIGLSCIISIICIIGIIFYSIKNNATYKEVYCLRYTIYYPGNTYTYEVDSCNHVYINSDRGTNYLRYYSIPDKETYGIYTSAPIVINKITKK